jgi:acyl phosphate:glycerol-3-phosphate acyltransferase
MLELTLKILFAYLFGSLIGALVVGWLRGGVDIRTMGSGNAGGTNALRTQGTWFACWVMLIDVGKGLLAVRLIAPLDLSSVLPPEELLNWPATDVWLQVFCAAAVVAGHVYPLWFDFRGGKGAATLLGVLVGLLPIAVIPVILVWALVLVTTGYVGLATILATFSFPIYLATANRDELFDPSMLPLFVFGVVMSGFVCFTHRSNIARMLSGTESHAQRVWLLRSRG